MSMSFKKNAFSYFVWIVFIMCNLVVFSFLSLMCAKVLGGPLPVVALGLAAAFFGLLFLLGCPLFLSMLKFHLYYILPYLLSYIMHY